jgi:DNA repair protein RecO (recombination protein O)
MYYQLKGLVLRVQTSAEADKLLTLYTCEWGKVTVTVPGVKKIGAKLTASTEPVTENQFMVYLNHPLSRGKVTGARLLESFPQLRTGWRRLIIAQYCAEICEALTPFNEENEQKYELLLRTWQLLQTAKHPWRILIAYMLRFLKLSGYSFPEYLSRHKTLVPAKEEQMIRRLSLLSGEAVDTDPELTPALERSIHRHIERYLELYLSRPLATRVFIQKLGAAKRKKR